jgi:hypothetical protein
MTGQRCGVIRNNGHARAAADNYTAEGVPIAQWNWHALGENLAVVVVVVVVERGAAFQLGLQLGQGCRT